MSKGPKELVCKDCGTEMEESSICAECGENTCSNCLSEGNCTDCNEQLTDDNEDDEDDE